MGQEKGGTTMPIEGKQDFLDFLRELMDRPAGEIGEFLQASALPNGPWHFAQPINDLAGPRAAADGFFVPLKNAMPDVECRIDLLFAGDFKERHWLSAMGTFMGSFVEPFRGVPPTQGVASLRFGSFHAIENGRIGESYMLFDLMDLIRQADLRLWPPSLGAEGHFPGPATHDGILLAAQEAAEGQKTIDLARAMGAGLRAYDGKTLESMEQTRFWHPKMMWYGPAGIGTTRGLKGFQDYHQIPFLEAFPDRVGGNHEASFGEGSYAGWVGWPSVRATHAGGNWLGLPATGKPITMRVMDFYRREGDHLRENWVFIDLLDIQIQLGLDPFARLACEVRRRRRA